MVSLVAVARALPGEAHPQQDITAMVGPLLTDDPARLALLRRLHTATGIRSRHLALPLQEYATLTSFGRANDAFITHGGRLAAEASRAALAAGHLAAPEIDFLLFTTVTGVSAPSLDAGLVGELGLRRDVRRMPSFGLGCAGGAAGIARLRDYLLGHPGQVGLLVSVELCSLTVQHGDDSTANLISCGLFGDGAAAVLMVGDEHPLAATAGGLDVLGSRSVLYPGTADQLGWHVGETGFAIMLAPGLPDTIAAYLATDVDLLLAEHGLTRAAVDTWVVHAGGPRIFDAVGAALDLPESALQRSRKSLAAVGNLSSSSVLHVLADTLEAGEPPPGGYALLLAFGPGVGAELVLARRPGRQ